MVRESDATDLLARHDGAAQQDRSMLVDLGGDGSVDLVAGQSRFA
jgi:hypothetical protein